MDAATAVSRRTTRACARSEKRSFIHNCPAISRSPGYGVWPVTLPLASMRLTDWPITTVCCLEVIGFTSELSCVRLHQSASELLSDAASWPFLQPIADGALYPVRAR